MTRTPLRAELLVDEELPNALRHELLTTLAGLGVHPGTVRAPVTHRGPAELGWLVLVSLPLHAFLSGLGQEAVRDAYQALRRLVTALARHRRRVDDTPPPRPLVLHDTHSGVRVVLEPDLPPAAYTQLHTLDLTTFRHGPVHYDRARQRWRSELDEAAH